MGEFSKFLSDYKKLEGDLPLRRECYEAGQKSQQAKIDELQKRVDTALNLISNWWHPDLDQKLFLIKLDKVLQGGAQNLKNTDQTIENIGVEGGAKNALRGEHD